MLSLYLILFLSLFNCIKSKSLSGDRTLVLYDERISSVDDYSNFFQLLNERSYELTTLDVSNANTTVDLFQNENRLYDNLIILPVKGKHLNKYTPAKRLLKFIEDGGNIISVTAPNAAPDSVRLYLNQLGIYPSPKDQKLIDYFHSNKKQEIDDTKTSSNNLLNDYVYTVNGETTFEFGKSSAALLADRDQVIPILKASKTSLTKGKSDTTASWTIGSEGYLVAGFQTLHNARSLWIGSNDFFLNKNFKINQDFITELIKWAFNEKSVIKSVGFTHSHVDGVTYDEVKYKINDDVVYEIGLSEWDGENWKPYQTQDIQFELKKVDPYYRINLIQSRKSKTAQYYTTGEFKLPNQHGMFKFLTSYKRRGLSFVEESDVKAVRHLANDEYPRSFTITNAWVYLTSIYGVILSFILFTFFFISTPIVTKKVKVEKKTN
ncbi:hypothetical protein KAFR_0L00650 [Kazachstania africana CBS 2517]|uniref:Dolichyl-diphosphooligosaccharide--protein glycosyltransferase subunit WBP1 n=1 Tax=Kazachstania africana (strain ATCC 22294 / BCRC 22015 / CBS 2517 / CECT 1963 / NBRC 1671 / NRRL Y-8276) TaxID=1071382 RepID=H2B222_KAZAF|nr:hypothetical protein KAFR_0L00650 [Kazachstania africana CBS 2517]CCF60672.1 hypothetical protein KAFR_0L00650 [Kazachstania africana CBS 2517]